MIDTRIVSMYNNKKKENGIMRTFLDGDILNELRQLKPTTYADLREKFDVEGGSDADKELRRKLLSLKERFLVDYRFNGYVRL